MIAIYRGEDTCFAGAAPLTVKLDTELDLTGFTADVLFGNIVKHFESDDVERKELPLSFTADETATLFPGKGYAVVKVYDTEGRVSILKKFVIDVRMRHAGEGIEPTDVYEAIASFDEIRKAAASIIILTEDDDTATVKQALNNFLAAVQKRGEYQETIDIDGRGVIPPSSVALFTNGVRSLKTLAQNLGELTEDSDISDIKQTINKIVAILSSLQTDSLRELDFSEVKTPKASVLSIRDWADDVLKILKGAK